MVFTTLATLMYERQIRLIRRLGFVSYLMSGYVQSSSREGDGPSEARIGATSSVANVYSKAMELVVGQSVPLS